MKFQEYILSLRTLEEYEELCQYFLWLYNNVDSNYKCDVHTVHITDDEHDIYSSGNVIVFSIEKSCSDEYNSDFDPYNRYMQYSKGADLDIGPDTIMPYADIPVLDEESFFQYSTLYSPVQLLGMFMVKFFDSKGIDDYYIDLDEVPVFDAVLNGEEVNDENVRQIRDAARCPRSNWKAVSTDK